MDLQPFALTLCEEKRGAVSNVAVVFLQIITDDDVDRISLCVRVVAERVPLMKNIFTVECRNSLSSMLDANKRGEEEKMNKVHFMYFTFTRERKPTVDNSEEKIVYFQVQRELTSGAESARKFLNLGHVFGPDFKLVIFQNLPNFFVK